MKKSFLLSALIIFFFSFTAMHSIAGYGYLPDGGSFVSFKVNGEINYTKYAIGQCSGCGLPSFQGANLGNNIASINLGTAEQRTYENGGDDVIDPAGFFYTIYPSSSRPLVPLYSFSKLGSTVFNYGGIAGNESRIAIQNEELVSGLTPNTNYTVEIYFRSEDKAADNSTGHYFYPGTAGSTSTSGPALFTATFRTGSILPVTFTAFSSETKTTGINLHWITSTPSAQLSHFVVQRSTNGIHFDDILTIDKNASGSYIAADNSPRDGGNYYRVTEFSLAGEKNYSKIIRVYYGLIDNTINVYSNPGNHNVNVRLIAVPKGTYSLLVFNDAGQKLSSQFVSHDGTDRTLSIQLPETTSTSIYRILLTDKTQFFKQSFIIH